jgi:hypothetical protein
MEGGWYSVLSELRDAAGITITTNERFDRGAS